MLGEWVCAQRTARGWNRSELARLIKVKPNTVSQWESGTRKKISPEHLAALAQVFGKTLEEAYQAAGVGSIAPTPRSEILRELRDRAAAVPSAREVQMMLKQVEAHYQASEDTWTALTSVLHSLLMEAEGGEPPQGAE